MFNGRDALWSLDTSIVRSYTGFTVINLQHLVRGKSWEHTMALNI
jgi:hypothetical protein